jgi:hypothetical protein
MKTAVYGVLGVGLVCSLVLLLLRRDPVLLSLRNDVRSDHGLQILNPFRSRQPEWPARGFLERLRAGECATVLEAIDPDRDRRRSICGKESEYPITGWRLEAVGYDQGRTVLRYRVERTVKGKRVDDPFWIWVSKHSESSWEVTGYEPWY